MFTRLLIHKRRHATEEEGFALIAAAIYLTVILLLGTSLIRQTVQESALASRVKKSAQAFNLAEAGIDYAAWQLYNHPSGTFPKQWTHTITGCGSYTVTASKYLGHADTLVLVSTSTVKGWTSKVKQIGTYLLPTVTGENLIFNNALFSNADASLSGTLNVTGDVFSNGKISLGGSTSVTGSVGAVGTVKVGGSSTVGSQKPYQPKVIMPVVDLQHYKDEASVILAPGDPLPNPLNGVVYIDGSYTFAANLKLEGKGVIVVNGNVTINKNVELMVNNKDVDEFAIVSVGTVKLNGNATIEGYIYTHNITNTADFSGNGTASITGGVICDVISKANGTLNVTWKQATIELPGANVAPAQFAGVAWRQVK